MRMRIEIIALCLTIAASVGGAAWQISGQLNGLGARITKVEEDIHDIRADIRSINEYLRGKEPSAARSQ